MVRIALECEKPHGFHDPAGMDFAGEACDLAANIAAAATRASGCAPPRVINACRVCPINQRRSAPAGAVAAAAASGGAGARAIVTCFLVAMATAATAAASGSGAGLIGENVCQRQERYTVNVTQFVLRNVTVRSYQWCMQVPPRCSTFTHRTINDSKIIEEERTRQVRECCSGYEPDTSGERCVPSCDLRCKNGKCNEESKCYCYPGYRGEYCDTVCDANRWGRYCRYHCECQRGMCLPEFGHCQCPPGWTGLKCEKQCQVGYHGLNCANSCECRADQICDPQDGHCTNRVRIGVLKKYHTFDTQPSNSVTSHKAYGAKKIDMYLLTTESSLSTPTTQDIRVSSTTSARATFSTTAAAATTSDVRNVHVTTRPLLTSIASSVASNYDHNISSKVEGTGVQAKAESEEVGRNMKSMDRKMMRSEFHDHEHLAKGKAAAEVHNVNTVKVAETLETIENMDASMEIDTDAAGSSPPIYNFATISFLCIIAVAASGFMIVAKLLKQREKTNLRAVNADSGTTPKIAKSIFHTPLPEPPQSPFFDSPPSPCAYYHHKRIGDNDVAINSRLSFSTVANSATLGYIDESNESEELSEEFYDQLPSTRGTYKAVVPPEPPPQSASTPPQILNSASHPASARIGAAPTDNCTPTSGKQANTACIFGGDDQHPSLCLIRQEQQPASDEHEHAENLYDEIPCWTRSTVNNTLYINTRIENKTQF